MAGAISLIDADMAKLAASALTPPLLLTPSGFEGEGQSWLSPSSDNTDLDTSAADRPQGPDASPTQGEQAPGPFGAEAG
jgi:hypothetical protein